MADTGLVPMMLELSKDSMRTGVGIPMSLPRFSMAPCVLARSFQGGQIFGSD